MEHGFLAHLKHERRYAAHTLASYTNDLGQLRIYLDSCGEDCLLQDLQSMHIRNWIVELMDQDYAIRSIQRKLSTLKSFFKYVRKRGYRKDNPVSLITAPKTAKRLPEFVDVGHMDLLLSAEGLFEDNLSGLRDRLILVLFYSTGMRLSELIGLKESDLEEHTMGLRVVGKRNKERIVPITRSTRSLIDSYLEAKNTRFGTTDTLLVKDDGEKLYPRLVYRKVNEYLGRVTTLSKKSPHILRHTFATHMLENGAELQSIKEILGHASLAATQVYTHNNIDRLKKIHTQAHPRG